MKDDPLFYLIVLALLGVLGILMFGIGSFGKGGEFAHKYSPLFYVVILFVQ